MIDINELRRLAQAATPGPWFSDARGNIWRRPLSDLYENGGSVAGDKPIAFVFVGWRGEGVTGYPVENNARLIAASNPSAVTELLDRLEAAESARRDDYQNWMTALDRNAELLAKLEAAETAWKEADKSCYDLTEKVIPNLRNRLEEAEKDIAMKERIIDSLGSELNAVANERDALRTELADLRSSMTFRTSLIGRIEAERNALHAKIEAMEQQEPVATVRINAINGNPSVDFVPGHRYLHHNDKLYLAPGAQNVPEKLCYDSRWEISIDYVDGWNAAIDAVRGKSPSWHCPDCCIAFPFGAPKSCPNDDPRCNSLLTAAPEAEGE